MSRQLTERQGKLLERYRALWTDLNAVDSLIEHLEDRRREIKAEQRRLANQIAAEDSEQQQDPAEGYLARALGGGERHE